MLRRIKFRVYVRSGEANGYKIAYYHNPAETFVNRNSTTIFFLNNFLINGCNTFPKLESQCTRVNYYGVSSIPGYCRPPKSHPVAFSFRSVPFPGARGISRCIFFFFIKTTINSLILKNNFTCTHNNRNFSVETDKNLLL